MIKQIKFRLFYKSSQSRKNQTMHMLVYIVKRKRFEINWKRSWSSYL